MMRVLDVMTREVETIAPGAGAAEAWEQMQANGIHHLVVSQGSTVIGVLSDRDIGGRRSAAFRANRRVTELMTAPAVSVGPNDTIRRAANLMRGRSIGCLVVTSKAKVVGIVTVSDLLELLGRGIQRPSLLSTRVTLKHRAPHRKRHLAYGVW